MGSPLKRLDRLQGRSVYRSNGIELRLEEMDEELFTLKDIVDFEVSIEKQQNNHLLNIEFWAIPGGKPDLDLDIRQCLHKIPYLARLISQGILNINRHPSYYLKSTLQSFGKKILQMGNALKKCKVVLKDAYKPCIFFPQKTFFQPQKT